MPVSPGMIAGRGPRRARRNAATTRLPRAPSGVVTSTSGNGPFQRSTTVTPSGSTPPGIAGEGVRERLLRRVVERERGRRAPR